MDQDHLLEIAKSLELFLIEFQKLHDVQIEVYNTCCGGPGTIAINDPQGGYADVLEVE